MSVDCLHLELMLVCLSVSVKISCLPKLSMSRPLLAFYCVYCLFSLYFIDLWLFVNKFCLEIVVAYCWYLSGLGFQKNIFLFC